MSRPDALTPKQERFVAEYLIDLNATQAAIRSGYSAKTAEQTLTPSKPAPNPRAVIGSDVTARPDTSRLN